MLAASANPRTPASAASQRLAAALGRSALETLYTATRVDELLAAGVEGMALGTDLDVQLGLRRARCELVAARAGDVRFYVFGMNSCLHEYRFQCSEAVKGAKFRSSSALP